MIEQELVASDGSGFRRALLKTSKVLSRWNEEGDPIAEILFAQHEHGADHLLDAFYMEAEDFEAFGRPDFITLTIEPGDRLNTEETA